MCRRFLLQSDVFADAPVPSPAGSSRVGGTSVWCFSRRGFCSPLQLLCTSWWNICSWVFDRVSLQLVLRMGRCPGLHRNRTSRQQTFGWWNYFTCWSSTCYGSSLYWRWENLLLDGKSTPAVSFIFFLCVHSCGMKPHFCYLKVHAQRQNFISFSKGF